MKRTFFLLAAVLALVLAACGSEQTDATASPTDVATPDATAAATPEPTETDADATGSPGATDAPTGSPSFELPNSAPELLALLPDEVGGQTPPEGFGEVSQTGEEFMEEGDDQGNEEFVAFLQRLGAQPSDVSVAMRFYADEDFESMTSIFAFRVAGADSGELLEEMENAFAEEMDGDVSWEEQSIGGKTVRAPSQPLEEETEASYLYVRNDIVFVVSASDDSLAEDALRQLP